MRDEEVLDPAETFVDWLSSLSFLDSLILLAPIARRKRRGSSPLIRVARAGIIARRPSPARRRPASRAASVGGLKM